MTKTGHSAPGGIKKMQLTQQKYRKVVQTPRSTVGKVGLTTDQRGQARVWSGFHFCKKEGQK